MEIHIKSTNTRMEETSKGTKLVKQQAAIEQGNDYPLAFDLVVDQPYPPGRYVIDPSCFKVNQFGGLELDRYNLRLVPIKG